MDVHAVVKRAGGVGKLATALGVTHSSVCDWQRKNALPAIRLLPIASALELDVADIAHLVTPPKPRASA